MEFAIMATVSARLSVESPRISFVPPFMRSPAETIFEEYLVRHGLTWEYETLPGIKRPDYVIPCASGKCVVEVKEIEDPDPSPKNRFIPDLPVRAKIRAARKQLREYKNLPCSLAIYSESIFGPYEPGVVLAAAFGPGYHRVGHDYSRIDPQPSFYRFLKKSELPQDRHFLADALLSPVANTTFSALIMLTRYDVNELNLEVWKRLYTQQESGREVHPDDQLQIENELEPTLGQSRRFSGTIRVIVIENRHRRVPFPEDLFRGPFDQRWGWTDDLCGPMWLGEKLEALRKEGVPFEML